MSSGSTSKRSHPSSSPSASPKTRQHLITSTSSTKPPNHHHTTTSSPTCLDSSEVNGVLTGTQYTFANTVCVAVPPTKCSNDISSHARNTTLNASRCRNLTRKETHPPCISRTSNTNCQHPSPSTLTWNASSDPTTPHHPIHRHPAPLHTTNTSHAGQLTTSYRRTSVFIVNPQFCAVRT